MLASKLQAQVDEPRRILRTAAAVVSHAKSAVDKAFKARQAITAASMLAQNVFTDEKDVVAFAHDMDWEVAEVTRNQIDC